MALTVGAGALALTAFLAVGREGLETTLFLWTAVKASGETVTPLIGAALGIIASVALCWLLYRKAIQLNLSKFFNATALALLVIAAGVLAYGIGSLQSAELLPGSSWIAFDLTNHVSTTSWWATIFTGLTALRFEMTVLQVAAWVAYLGITVPAFVLAGRAPLHRSLGRSPTTSTRDCPSASRGSPGVPGPSAASSWSCRSCSPRAPSWRCPPRRRRRPPRSPSPPRPARPAGTRRRPGLSASRCTTPRPRSPR